MCAMGSPNEKWFTTCETLTLLKSNECDCECAVNTTLPGTLLT